MTALACPQCGSTDLRTIETIIGTCYLSCIERDENGELDFEHCGETDVCWDSTTSTGLECGNCLWQASGETMDEWCAQLVPFVEDEPPHEPIVPEPYEPPPVDVMAVGEVHDLLAKAFLAGLTRSFTWGEEEAQAQSVASEILREVGK